MTSAAQPGKVLVCGDWHENWSWGAMMIRWAAANGAHTLVHVGDLGVGTWDGSQANPDPSAAALEHWLSETGLRLVFLDGNHDDHARLATLPVDEHGMGILSPHMRHARRGTRLDLDLGGTTVRAGFLGGAVSVNRRLLKPGVNWWPTEVTTSTDLARLGEAPLDVLFTHDAPIPTDYEMEGLAGPGLPGLPLDALADSRSVRELLHRAVTTTRPDVVLCGHWHTRASGSVAHPGGRTRVEILNKERMYGNAVWLVPGDNGPEVAPALDGFVS